MFASFLLDMRLAVLAVMLSALLEAATHLASRGTVPKGERGPFIRQRFVLVLIFILGLAIYHRLKGDYLYDPFFDALYTFFLAFALFYYVTGIAGALASLAGGTGTFEKAGSAPYLMTTLVLFALVLAKPQTSHVGFFCGAAAHLAGNRDTGWPGSRWRRFWLTVFLGAILFLAISVLSR